MPPTPTLALFISVHLIYTYLRVWGTPEPAPDVLTWAGQKGVGMPSVQLGSQ